MVVGAGDDAAVVSPGSGEQVLTTDAMVEGVHFRTDLTTPRDLGYKAIRGQRQRRGGDGCEPTVALCALTLSTAIDAAWVVELAGGMRECCATSSLARWWAATVARCRGAIVVTVTGEVGAATRMARRLGGRRRGRSGGSAAGLEVAAERSWLGRMSGDALRRARRLMERLGEAGVLASHGATSSDGHRTTGWRWTPRGSVGRAVGARIELVDLHALVPLTPARR